MPPTMIPAMAPVERPLLLEALSEEVVLVGAELELVVEDGSVPGLAGAPVALGWMAGVEPSFWYGSKGLARAGLL